jgi:hypothetical protein
VQSDRIVKAIIYPFLGIARVGNSAESGSDGFFIGPETSEPPEPTVDFYRDRFGALKRQAARFRLYGLNADNEVVKELTADNATIEWTVHLCNRKAHWYQFQIAQDIAEAKSMPPPMPRNSTVADRSCLIIDPGPRTISGRSVSGHRRHRFDTGTFMGVNVPLGEVRTDRHGRLLVLGGHGAAGSADGTLAYSSANNESWYDDTSDGPVTATAEVDDRKVDVVSAWVAVAPPNYAPMLKSVRTMWDRIEELKGMPLAPPSFARDILPIFHRLSMLQWVNWGFAGTFGWGGPYDFQSLEWTEKLASRDDSLKPLRTILYKHFRQPDRDGTSPVPWPWIYGDALLAQPRTANIHACLGPNQMEALRRWANGDFVSDCWRTADPPPSVDDLPIEDRGPMLDRAAMEFCVADVFEPGIELPFFMRQASLYLEPGKKPEDDPFFPRIRRAPDGWQEPFYGACLDYSCVPMVQIPGSLTRWLAVPWQSDAASCLAGYTDRFGRWAPTLWPARVPNHVIAESDYNIISDPDTDPAKRALAFTRRTPWQPNTNGLGFGMHVAEIVANPANLGLVVGSPGPLTGDVPERIYVEYRQTPR